MSDKLGRQDGAISSVLVVDDDIVNREILEALLSRLTCNVRSVAGGAEALEALAHSPADLIITDFHMPKMDGLELTREIRRREGSGRRTPIIGLTASDDSQLRQQCQGAGMDDVLMKPVMGEQLRHVLSKWVAPVDDSLIADLQEQLGGSDSELYRQTLATFLQESQMHLITLAEAVPKGQSEIVQHEAHTLKGSSGYFGAHTFQNLCRTMESLARAKETAAMGPILKALQDEFGRVRDALKAEGTHGST
jgi:two-component system, sensor histidine kinase and response regulator